MAGRQQPQRTCVVCRQKKDKRELTRIVRADDKLVVDKSGKLDGRGAYLCDNPACWEQAKAHTLIAKALRIEMSDNDRMVLRQMKPA